MTTSVAEDRLVDGESAVDPKWITRALRVEIVKPLNCTWDEAGQRLRDMRSIVHRLYDAAAQIARWTDYRNRHGEVAGHPKTRAYQAVEEELVEIREWAAKAARKAKKAAKEEGKAADTAMLDRLSAIEFPGGVKGAISVAAFAGFRKWNKGGRRTSYPSWGYGAPIPVRASDSSLRITPRGVSVLAKLSAGHGDPIEFAVQAGKGKHFGRLRALAKAETEPNPRLKRGELKILYSEKDKKWFLFIAYSEPPPIRPDTCDPDHVMVLHRGYRNLLVCATNHGRYQVLATGKKLLAFKRGMEARRESFQAVTRAERGSGAHGHGRGRRYEVSNSISEKEKNHVHTLCQQLGARVAQLAVAWGCGTVAIESYGGIEPDADRAKRVFIPRFPNAELKGCVAWSLKKIGIELGEYEHAFMSQTCPCCDSVDEGQINRRTGVFHCRVCSFDRDVDLVGSLHALRRTCEDRTAGTIWENRLKFEAKLADAIRGGTELPDPEKKGE